MAEHIPTSCEECLRLLALSEDDLSPTDRTHLSTHLESCASCSATHAEYQQMDVLIADIPEDWAVPDAQARLQKWQQCQQHTRKNQEGKRSDTVQAAIWERGSSSFTRTTYVSSFEVDFHIARLKTSRMELTMTGDPSYIELEAVDCIQQLMYKEIMRLRHLHKFYPYLNNQIHG